MWNFSHKKLPLSRSDTASMEPPKNQNYLSVKEREICCSSYTRNFIHTWHSSQVRQWKCGVRRKICSEISSTQFSFLGLRIIRQFYKKYAWVIFCFPKMACGMQESRKFSLLVGWGKARQIFRSRKEITFFKAFKRFYFTQKREFFFHTFPKNWNVSPEKQFPAVSKMVPVGGMAITSGGVLV